MWTTQHQAVTDAAPEDVWATIRDLHTGRLTLPGGDIFELHGLFEVGSQLSVTPAGQDTFVSTITELVENERYADSTEFDGLSLVFRHTLEAVGAGTVVTHELEIDGPAADEVGPELGPQISGDFPEQLQALFAAAHQRR
jgi:hypothetical protein